MKRILFLNNGYPTSFNSQYTTYASTIANCLKKAGYNVDLLVIRYNRRITFVYKIVKYIFYWMRALSVNLKDYELIYINHLPFVWPILLNRGLYRKKVYIHWHGGELVSNTFFIRRALKFVSPRICFYQHIVPSFYFKRKLIEILNVPSDLIFVSPSGGVDINLFIPCKKKANDERFVIGFSGALTTGKGADMLLELMKVKDEIEHIVNKKVIFKIINYGKEANYYIPLFKRATEDIEIVDKMHKKNMPSFYNSISILLFPSIRMGESLGLVVLEAMSCNRPVVTFDIRAFPEFVRSRISGELVVYSFDLRSRVEEMKKAIIKIANNYSVYSPRTVVENEYSEKSVVEFYRKLDEK